MTVKRYDLLREMHCANCDAELVEIELGDWVSHDDHLADRATLEAEREELKGHLDNCRYQGSVQEQRHVQENAKLLADLDELRAKAAQSEAMYQGELEAAMDLARRLTEEQMKNERLIDQLAALAPKEPT